MKKIFYMILFALVIANFCSAQIITFDKTLPASSAVQVLQMPDGGYLLISTDHFKFIKTDAFGYIEWIKEFPELGSRGEKICKTLDGGYAAVGFKNKIGAYNDICLVKLDSQLDTVWTKTYGLPQIAEWGQSLIQLPDSSFIISSLGNVKFILMKTDVNGSLIWSKELLGFAPILIPSYLVNLNDGNFLFGKKSSLVKMNSDADTIWTNSLSGSVSAALTEDGFILQSSNSYLQKLDLNGNIIWQKEIGNVKSYAQSSIGNYILLTRSVIGAPSSSKVIEIDTSGNILSEIAFENSGEYIINADDDGFAICGSVKQDYNHYYAWLLKTDNNLNYSAINFKQPIDGDKLNIFSSYPLIWKANNVNYVNIDYSIDNQNSWNNIINYYPAAADTFNWSVPDMPSGNLFIRIRNSFNPDIYDRSDPPQLVINYQSTDYISANEIFMWIGNNGMGSHDPRSDGSGFFWPGGENSTIPAIYEDGLVWGGKVNGEVRINGSTYRHGLTPGYILPNGSPSNPLDVKSKIFKLKKDWQYLPPSAERDRYEFDFLNWPVDVGAPWDDNNGDGVYTPGIDNPKIFGDETLFFAANDLDTANTQFTYGSNPIGLEFQVTTFGYNSELLKDVVFKKYKVINKSPNTITDMYLSYWTDDDLGFAGDDYVGCDTLLNLGYTYNADNNDQDYYGTPPPAVGHLFVQPPIAAGELTDSARYESGWKKGFRNISVNSFLLFICCGPLFSDPSLGVYDGTLEFYNYMQGLNWDGSPIIDPIIGLPTHFVLAGDPVSGTGWYEGAGWPGGYSPGDRKFLITTGKFDMAPSDTQEVVVAILIKKGTDNLNSITEIKNYATLIQNWYDNDFVVDVEDNLKILPSEFSLSQNYPNPFNPITKIKYTIPSVSPLLGGARGGSVSLKVYDILGNEVATLVDEYKPAGKYEVNFDASKLSSGVYFYRLKAGSFIQTKKMIVLR